MGLRRILTAVGAGVTTFLLVTVLVIEAVNFEFSAIIGLPVGLLAGIAVFAGLWSSLADLPPRIRLIATAYATFGLTIILLLGLSYVNIGRGLFSVRLIVFIGIAVATIVLTLSWLIERKPV